MERTYTFNVSGYDPKHVQDWINYHLGGDGEVVKNGEDVRAEFTDPNIAGEFEDEYDPEDPLDGTVPPLN